jgi:acyl dehydratase
MFFEDVTVGAELPELAIAPLEPADFARYAAASGDDNPLHRDHAAAVSTGEAGVIAHGMLLMGLLGRVADDLAGPYGRRHFAVRFRDKTRPGDALRCGGRISAAYEREGACLVEVELWVRDQHGATKASGSLTAALPRRPSL